MIWEKDFDRSRCRFEARVYIPGVKNPYCLYDRKLSTLKKKTREFKEKKAPLAERYNPQINVSVWYEEWMRLYIIPVNKKYHDSELCEWF